MSEQGMDRMAEGVAETEALPRTTLTAYCSGCGEPEPTGFHVATCSPAQRRMRVPLEFTPIEKTCPYDGQSLAWHLVSESGPNGRPRTNAAFLGCAWPIPCGSQDCDGDGRYASPGRGHREGCTHPITSPAETTPSAPTDSTEAGA